jgi:hypothetical protein
MRQILVSIIIFLIFFFLGASLRAIWFFTFQKRYLEYLWFEKPLKTTLAKMKGGADSPQEAWEKYLSALERGDIEEAKKYIWDDTPENPLDLSHLYFLKEKGLLKKYRDCDKKLIQDTNYLNVSNKESSKYNPIEERYKARCREYKEVELFLIGNSDPVIKQYWENEKRDVIEVWNYFIFKYNPITKKWFID